MNYATLIPAFTNEESRTRLALDYIEQLSALLKTLDTRVLHQFVEHLLAMKRNGGTLYICGNGGSAANALHLTNDFLYGTDPDGGALKVEALVANVSVLSCLGNDIDYAHIFSHQLKVKARVGDVLMVLTGSGNSENVINALLQAKSLGMHTAGVLGFDGGKAKPLLDTVFHFEKHDMQMAEDCQTVVGHLLMKLLHQVLSPSVGR